MKTEHCEICWHLSLVKGIGGIVQRRAYYISDTILDIECKLCKSCLQQYGKGEAKPLLLQKEQDPSAQSHWSA